MIDALPTGRNSWGVGMTLPGMTSKSLGGSQVSDVGGIGAGQQAYLSIHGSSISDTHYELDGMNVTSSSGGGNNISVYFDDAQVQEYTFDTIGGGAESQISGVVVNMVPKEGGNVFKGTGVVNWANSSLYDSNYTDDLRARGLLSPSEMRKLWDYNASVGGPILNDRLWFFASERYWGSDKTVPVTFNQPGVTPEGQYSYINRLYSTLVRLTSQINEKNKVSGYYAWMPRTRPYINTSSGLNLAVSYAPSGTMWAPTFSPYVGQLKWTSTISSRMLAEAGYSINHYSFGTLNQDFIPAGAVTKEDTVLATQWNAGDGDTRFAYVSQVAVGKLSYITGSHALKGGLQYQTGWFQTSNQFAGDLDQQYANGRPFQVQVFNSPIDSIRSDLNAAIGLFVQDAWTIGRLTAHGGLRYDYLKASVPAQSTGAGTFVPARSARGRHPPEVEELVAARGSGVRPVRKCADRAQVQRRAVRGPGGHHVSLEVQPAQRKQRAAQLDRLEPGRHRTAHRDRCDAQRPVRPPRRQEHPRSELRARLQPARERQRAAPDPVPSVSGRRLLPPGLPEPPVHR